MESVVDDSRRPLAFHWGAISVYCLLYTAIAGIFPPRGCKTFRSIENRLLKPLENVQARWSRKKS